MDRSASPGDWRTEARRRFCTHAVLKGGVTTIGMTLFFVVYFHLLDHPAYPVRVMPLTVVDHWIGFHALALVPYISLWVYISLVPAMLPDLWALVRFSVFAIGLSFVGYACFYFWPTAVPAMDVDWTRYPGLSFLKQVDAAGNACPSLHVAFAVFSGVALDGLWRDMGGGTRGRWLNLGWSLAIVYSTMGTKQHVFLDVVAGAVLGLIAGLCWWRWCASSVKSGYAARAADDGK